MQTLRLGSADDHVIYDPRRIDAPGAWLFDVDDGRWDAVDALRAGRGRISFLRLGGEQWVLRHYARGGLPARLGLRDYLWTGLRNSRPWREFTMLAQLHREGLPVPEPVAARVRRRGLVYGGALLTRRIEAAEPLQARLARAPLAEADWQRIGRLCADLHRRRIHHSDLNVGNILVDDRGGFHVIDFDNAREAAPRWLLAAGMRRLRRSLRKAQARQPDLHADEQCWTWLMAGYREGLVDA